MTDLPLDKAVFLISTVVYTLATAWTDLRLHKIFNLATVPMFLLGWIYQGFFHGWDGIMAGAQGFAVGFGLFLTLWMVGSAGGGDVKLLGGLSVWLGTGLTLKVILLSLIFVAIGTIGTVMFGLISSGKKSSETQVADERDDHTEFENVTGRSNRRVMPFAIPVALATWAVLALFQNQW